MPQTPHLPHNHKHITTHNNHQNTIRKNKGIKHKKQIQKQIKNIYKHKGWLLECVYVCKCMVRHIPYVSFLKVCSLASATLRRIATHIHIVTNFNKRELFLPQVIKKLQSATTKHVRYLFG